MRATLYGYNISDGKYEWRTNTYYKVGQNNVETHTRQPDVACAVDIGYAHWIQVLDTLLADGERPCVYLPDGSLYQLNVMGNIESYDSYYSR